MISQKGHPKYPNYITKLLQEPPTIAAIISNINDEINIGNLLMLAGEGLSQLTFRLKAMVIFRLLSSCGSKGLRE